MSERFSGSNQARVTTRAMATMQTRHPREAKQVRTDPLPEERIESCLVMVRKALTAKNELQAHAAIDWAFTEEPAPVLTLDSSIAELGMQLRTSGMLEALGIFSIRQLANMTPESLRSIRGFGGKAIEECQDAIRNAILGGLTDEQGI